MTNLIPTLSPGIRLIAGNPARLLKDIQWLKRWCGNPNPRRGEGSYYRYLENTNTGQRCLQMVIFYRVQWFPYHNHDFAPIFFYFDAQDRLERILYDFYHHNVVSLSVTDHDQPVRIIVYAPWHAFRVDQSHWAQTRFTSPYLPLSDDQIVKWWLYPDMRQFKLRSKFVNPWCPTLFPETTPFPPSTFRDEAPCPTCGEVFHLDFMPTNGVDTFNLEIICKNGHHYQATYHLDEQRMEVGMR
jgi:hypothetical protein